MEEQKDNFPPPSAMKGQFKSPRVKKTKKKKQHFEENVPEDTATVKLTEEPRDQAVTTKRGSGSNIDDTPSSRPLNISSSHEKVQEPSPPRQNVATSPTPRKRLDSIAYARKFIQNKKEADVKVNVVEERLPDLLHSGQHAEEVLFGASTARTLSSPSDPPGVSRPGNRRQSSVRFGQTTYREIEDAPEDNIPRAPRNFANAISVLTVGGAFLVVLFYFVYMLKPPPGAKIAAHCITEDCHASLAYLDNVTDSRIDPCLDFFGHVCNSWTSQVSDRDVGFLQDARSVMLKKINRTLVVREAVPPDRYGTHIFYSFYKSCHDFMTSRSKEPELPHLTFQRHFGSLRDFLGKTYPSVLTTLIRLSLENGLDSVFGVSMVRDKVYSKLLISRTRSIREKLSVHEDPRIEGYVINVLQSISASLFPVLEYHSKLMALDTKVQSVFVSDEDNVREIPFTDVELLAKEITATTWLKTVNDVLPPERKLIMQSRIKTRGFNATRQVLGLLKDSSKPPDDKLKSIYVYFQLLAEVLYLDYRRRFAKADSIRTCLEASQNVLTHTWPYLFASSVGANNSSSTINVIYASVSEAVMSFEYLSWMDSKTELVAMSVVKNTKLAPLQVVSSTDFEVEANYDTLTLNGSFINNYIALLSNEQPILHKFPRSVRHYFLNTLQLDGPLSYYQPLSSVIVPAVYRIAPLLYSHVGELQYFDVSTVGILMAKELSRTIGPSLGSTWWSSKTKSRFDNSFQCLLNMYERMAPSPYMDKIQLAEAIFAWTRSVRLMYDVLRTHSKQSSAWMATAVQRVFFKRFCLLSCTSDPRPRPLTPRQQCMLPVLNMPEFSEAFQCAQGLGASAHVCKIL
ncbi:neprilysin-1-like [Ornithodoros turicata]|uniref:neprilysin-1-like n=1 Tax=Ornithodoros turicata TaxID=34597 RepID=UPI003139725C